MKKLFAFLLIFAMALSCLSGCGTQTTSTASDASSVEPSQASPEPQIESPAPGLPASVDSALPPDSTPEDSESTPFVEVSYPLTEEDITLSFMNRTSPAVLNYLENGDWNNHILIKAAEEITGVHIDYTAVPAPSVVEVYSLSFASGDLSDIYSWGVYQYGKGADNAVEEGIFIPLNDLIDEYAPNYKAARESSEDIMRDTISDEGNIVTFYVLNTESVYSGMGYMTRQDLLDQAGLDVPVTYDDWYEMLTAYKNLGVAVPTSNVGDMGGLFFGGYGFEYNWIDFMNVPFYQVDGQVKFSPFADNFKQMLETLNQWYSEGLVLEDFYTMHNLGEMQSREFNGEIGVWSAYPNAVDLFNRNTTIPDAKSVALPNPVLKEGDEIHISTSASLVGSDCGAVSTACQYPELAVQWLDFWYGEIGSQLYNYGVEGVSFEYDDQGEPQLTDLILHNPEGLTLEDTQILYLGYSLPGLKDPTVLLENYSDNQLEAMQVWTSNADDAWNYPVGASLSAEESEAYNTAYSDISTYLAENTVAFVTGAKDLATFDEFIDTLKSMGIDQCISLKQTALERYYERALQ